MATWPRTTANRSSGYTSLRNHTRAGDELYVWISGSFTQISHDGTETKFPGPAYVSHPGNAPTHEIRCGGKELCLFYLRYSRQFDFQNGYHTQAKSGGYAPISYRNRAPCVSPTCPVCHLVCYPGPAPRE